MFNQSNLCFAAKLTTSSGVWLGDHPLDYVFPVFLVQLTIIFIATRISHTVLGPIGLPKHICHIITGIALGPAGLSRNLRFRETVFPDRSLVHLDLISHIAFILFIFVIAVKTDLGLVRKSGWQAVFIALTATIFPFLLIFVAIFFDPTSYSQPPIMHNSLQLADRWAVTSNIVTAYCLAEFRLLTSKLGRLAMSASLIADFYSIILAALFLFGITLGYHSRVLAFTFLGSFVGLVVLIWLLARPVAVWMIRRTPEGTAMDGAFLLTIMLMAIASSLGGQLIGQSVTLGPLFLGVIIPGGPPLGTAVVDRLDRLVSELFLPGFLIMAGLRTNLHAMFSGVLWGVMTSFIAITVAGKVCGVMTACLYYKKSFRDAFILALILNIRGIVEISSFNNLKDFHELTDELYASNIMAIIVVGGISSILLKALYSPSTHLEVHRRRTVQACAGAGELRILTCVHCEDHVPPLLTLLDTVSPTASSPICIYLLHLSPLVGRSSTILAPYKKKQGSKSKFRALSDVSAAAEAAPAATVTDRIVNSFVSLAGRHPAGHVAVQPFISVSPYATMHHDVCSLAVDKMCDLILVPFHRSMDADIPLESANPAIRSFNIDILLYAPCSVAILVSRGLLSVPACPLDARRHTHRVLILFLGGPDDREALAIASRMIDNPSIGIHVLRLVPPRSKRDGKWNSEEEEQELDDEAVEEFRSRSEGVDRVEYREAEVEEGAETVRLMKEMDGICDVLIVGRGEGRATPFTSGLEMWSEYPELGVLGDILASPDFGGSVSVMVVQQRLAVAGDAGGGLLRRAGSKQSSKSMRESVDLREGKLGLGSLSISKGPESF